MDVTISYCSWQSNHSCAVVHATAGPSHTSYWLQNSMGSRHAADTKPIGNGPCSQKADLGATDQQMQVSGLV